MLVSNLNLKYDNGTMETYIWRFGLSWCVKLNVPYGGTSGKVYSTSTEGSAVKDMIYSWGMCEVSGNLSCVPVVSTGGGSRVLPNFLVPKPSNDATDPVPIDDSVDRRRYIGGKNVVIGGLLMIKSARLKILAQESLVAPEKKKV